MQAADKTKPIDHGLPGHGSTLKKFRTWIGQTFGLRVSRSTIRNVLRRAGYTWKKVKKLLGRGCAAKREEFIKKFRRLYEKVCAHEVLLIYIDEARFHTDMDLGYVWAPEGVLGV